MIMEFTVKTIKHFVSKRYSENRFRSCPFISKTLTCDLKLYNNAVKKTVANSLIIYFVFCKIRGPNFAHCEQHCLVRYGAL
jgi:hypothetical protein